MAKGKTRYAVVIDGVPGAFGLWVPDMPGCTSMGTAVDELLQNAQEALRMWAEDALADGETLPAPRSLSDHQGIRCSRGFEAGGRARYRAAVDRNRPSGQGEPFAGRLAPRRHRRRGGRARPHAIRFPFQRGA